MKRLQNNTHWIIAMVGIGCLIIAVAGMSGHHSAEAVPAARDARALSLTFREVARQALPSIVSISTTGKTDPAQTLSPFGENPSFDELFRNHPQFREFFRTRPFRMPPVHGMGSGFIIDPSGTILTNNHVVKDANEISVKLYDGREFPATVIGTDSRSDVAVIRIEAPRGLKAIRLGNSDQMEIGDWVLAVGSPFGYDMSVTAGIISAKGRGPNITEREDFLQTDAAINPGNSGGPLLNLNGEVIGINTAISSRSGGYDGIGFAIPVNIARWVSQQLVDNGSVKRAYIGVGIREVDNDWAKRFRTPIGQGAWVYLITPNSPAAKADLQPGDVILEVDGTEVKGTHSLQGIIEKLQIGKTYPLKILRNGKPKTLRITVGEMPEDLTSASLSGSERRGPSSKNTFDELGLQIDVLSPDVAKELGLTAGEGVLVSSVAAGSLADLAGLRVGDVIEKVGTTKVNNPDNFRKALKEASLEKGVLLIVRNDSGTRLVVIQSKK